MDVSDTVWDLVNFRKTTAGFLATADGGGRPNVACLGSLQLSDRGTMTMLVGDNRTLKNLKENPYAAFITASGDAVGEADGCRVYLEVTDIVEEGPVVDKGRQMIAEAVNPEAATTIKAFVSFEVTGTRPLVDPGH